MLDSNIQNVLIEQSFPMFGITEDNVLNAISDYNALNTNFNDGKILNSICSVPLPIAVKAFTQNIYTNLGDNRLFPGAINIERTVTSMLGDLLNNPDAFGNVVSGGTEANLLAMIAAKKYKKNGRFFSPEVIVPSSVHFSIDKIADILGIKLKKAALDSKYEASVAHIAELINENTIGIIATLGTSELGAVDDIGSIAKIAKDNDIYFHVDAATGGFIVPFTTTRRHQYPHFDFSVEGVCSITIDPHKYGLSVIPSGYILFRNEEIYGLLDNESHYQGTHTHKTFLGTRSGAAASSVYSVIKYLGKCGFEALVNDLMSKTQNLVDLLKQSNWELLTEPKLSIVVIKCEQPEAIMQELQNRGWIVSLSKRHSGIRVVVHHHHTAEHLKYFVNTLNTAPEKLRVR